MLDLIGTIKTIWKKLKFPTNKIFSKPWREISFLGISYFSWFYSHIIIDGETLQCYYFIIIYYCPGCFSHGNKTQNGNKRYYYQKETKLSLFENDVVVYLEENQLKND